MPTVNIAPATRQGMKLLISLFGLSETGKTYSALKLMAGIEPNPAKRGLLDTEGGERGRAYVDAIPGGFMYGALTAPFTPERYMEALNDFVAAGVTTLVVDSASHAWFAAGGVLDMVEQSTATNDMAKWAKPKRRLGKLTGQWLGCGLHIILCARAKQPLVEVVVNGKKTYVPGPITPVQEKTLRYDMTIMALMLGDGQFSIAKEDGGKCLGALRSIFAASPVMDETMGRKLIEWIGGQDVSTPTQRKLSMMATNAAEVGSAALKKFWDGCSKDDKLYLKPSLDNLKSIAAATDAEAERVRLAEQDASADLSDPFGAGSDKPALQGGVSRVGDGAAPADDSDDFPGEVTRDAA